MERFEGEPRLGLEVRAHNVLDIAVDQLHNPDLIQTCWRRYYKVADHNIEFRATMTVDNAYLTCNSSRYLYINGPHEIGQCNPNISINVSELVNEFRLKGLISAYDFLPKLINDTPADNEHEKSLLALVFELLDSHGPDIQILHTTAREFERRFMRCMQGAAKTERRSISRQHLDGSWINMSKNDREGEEGYLWPNERYLPLIEVSSYRPGDVNRVVLVKAHDEKIETHEELADSFERAAQLAGPDDRVTRDEEGKIIAVMRSGLSDQEFTEISRYVSPRNIEQTILGPIEYYTHELLLGNFHSRFGS
jgi:hypothetical protein